MASQLRSLETLASDFSTALGKKVGASSRFLCDSRNCAAYQRHACMMRLVPQLTCHLL